ncbi:MAG: glycosyltransferase [Clostridiales bacterium]|nr:glycosyltransferase [Clostridiales bacterium]
MSKNLILGGKSLKQPIVSVIMPVYNGETYLRQCLDSVVNQTLKEIEIICVDDGSSDRSVEILKEYAAKDERVMVLQQENAGAGAARNNGLSKASGKYLSFLDSDDFFETDMLEKAVAKIEADRADFVVFRCDHYLNDTNTFKKAAYTLKKQTLPPYTPFNFRQITDNVFKAFVGWAWDKVYDREFVMKHNLRFQEQRTSNDMLFVFSALVLAKRITCLDEVLAHQRRNNGESLSNTREKSWFCFYNALKALRDVLKEKGLYEELKKDFINYAVHFSLWNLNTITGECYEKLYTKLHEEWFEELEVTGHDEDYFYNKTEYKQLADILRYDFKEYNTKISVVIPVYNAEKYIRQCLDSILTKQKISLEVICVDDCSTDGTPAILKEYEEKYENVQVIRNETNLYAGTCRNKGLMAAKGQYVHFLDSDDYVVDNAYEKLYTLAKENDLDWVKTTSEGFDDETGETIENPRYSMEKMYEGYFGTLLNFKDFPKKFMDHMAVVPWNGIYKRHFLLEKNIRFNSLFCVNDRSFFVDTCVKGERMMIAKEKIVRHRMNVSGSLVMKRAQHFDCQFESYRIMRQICNENHVNDKVRFEILEHEMYDIFVWYRKFLEQGVETERLKQDMKSFLEECDISYFEKYGTKSRWLKFRDLAGV